MSNMTIQQPGCHTVAVEGSNVYLRLNPILADGTTGNVWYVATRSGWELLPDPAADNLESQFQNAQPKGTLQ